jgi:hypothetical protein
MALTSPEVDDAWIEARRAHLRALLASHRRWRWLFGGMGLLSLSGLGFLGAASPRDAGLLRKGCLGLSAFLLVNAVASAWKSRILARRLRAMDAPVASPD